MTAHAIPPLAGASRRRVPPLEPGDHLTRDEFERRFDATPGLKKAELIEGVVYMAPPVRADVHGTPHAYFVGLLFAYCAATPGVEVADNASIRLDLDSLPQPDAALWIDARCGGQCRLSDDGYVEGAPELTVEISGSTASIDLNNKFEAYRRNRVREYVVWRVYDEAIDHFVLENGQFVLDPAADQIIRSRVFPGLWVDSAALIRRDRATAMNVLQQGIASSEHGNS